MDEDKELLIRLDERYGLIVTKLDDVLQEQRKQAQQHSDLRVKVAGISGTVSLITAALTSWIANTISSAGSAPPIP